MTIVRGLTILLFCLAASAIFIVLLMRFLSSNSYHVAGPFYLQSPTAWDRDNMTLYRCPKEASSDICARDPEFPDATIFAAGADGRYVVIARHPRIRNRTGDVTYKSITEYFYFPRAKNESYEWDSVKIIGPLTPTKFAVASTQYRLPPLSIILDDLK